MADAPPAQEAGGEQWKRDRQNREYAPAVGRSGKVYRQGNETVEEARARDAKGPKDRKPRSRPRAALPPKPTGIDSRQLEHALTEALTSPSMAAAMVGDQWLADHFTREGPNLARNLVAASERNPWLRQKLEALMTGEDFMVKFITALGVGGALIGYALPPLLYVLPIGNDRVREMFGVPERPPKEEARADAPPAPPAAAPESPAAPAGA